MIEFWTILALIAIGLAYVIYNRLRIPQYNRLNVPKENRGPKRKVIESKIVGDYLHEKIDSSKRDNEIYGPCLCCGAEDLVNHRVGVFNTIPASTEGSDELVWQHILQGRFEDGKRVKSPGYTDIIDHYFELIQCPSGGNFIVHSLHRRGQSTPTILKREIIPAGIASYISHWRDLGSYLLVSPTNLPQTRRSQV